MSILNCLSGSKQLDKPSSLKQKYAYLTIDSGNFLQKVRFLDILVIFRLDLSQITFDPVEIVFATNSSASLPPASRFSAL